jgi:Lon protease-like protein
MTRTIGMFPLSTVLFPQAWLPLHVFEPRYRALMSDCHAGGGEFGVVLISRGSEVGGGDQRVDVGAVARIARSSTLDDGRLVIVAEGRSRFRVVRWLDEDPYPRAEIEDFDIIPATDATAALSTAEASVRRLRSLLSELGDVPALPHDLRLEGSEEEIAWQLCELAPVNLMDRQQLLASDDLLSLLAHLADLCDASCADVVSMLSGGPGLDDE